MLLATALQIFAMVALNAQQISGTVKDGQGNGISNATVSLMKAKDSSIVKLALSKEGAFSFSQVSPDSLLVSISYIGQQTFYSDKFSFNGNAITLPAFTLQSASVQLQAVTVLARKKLVDIKPDRTILNVEGTINSTGSDALELLRKSPGVTVDNDEKLSINGKTGVQVYIDNKPSPLNGQDLSNYLKSIPSGQIEAIEIIHNPGAMYAAAGSGGIINIRLKKSKTMGFNGSVNAGISVSKNARWEEGLSLNYRKGNLNAYASYNANVGKQESEWRLQRTIKDTSFDQRNKIVNDRHNFAFKAGLDYSLNQKSNIGVMVNANSSYPKTYNRNTTPAHLQAYRFG